MSKTPRYREPPSVVSEARDDLTEIKGIGPVRQAWFNEVLGVRTFRDLTNLKPADIELQLQGEGRGVSREEIDMWLSQARHLMTLSKSREDSINTSTLDEPLPHQNVAQSTEVKDDWLPIATFAVEFQKSIDDELETNYQTTVHHMESDTDAMWSGIETDRLCQWMFSEIDDELKTVQEPQASKDEEPVQSSSSIGIIAQQINVHYSQNDVSSVSIVGPNQPIAISIDSLATTSIEAVFELSKPITNELALVDCQVDFSIRGRINSSEIYIGASVPVELQVGRTVYSARLDDIGLEPGMYRLQILVLIKTTPPSIEFFEIPLVHVT